MDSDMVKPQITLGHSGLHLCIERIKHKRDAHEPVRRVRIQVLSEALYICVHLHVMLSLLLWLHTCIFLMPYALFDNE